MKYWDEKRKRLLTKEALTKATTAPTQIAGSDANTGKTPVIGSEKKKVSK